MPKVRLPVPRVLRVGDVFRDRGNRGPTFRITALKSIHWIHFPSLGTPPGEVARWHLAGRDDLVLSRIGPHGMTYLRKMSDLIKACT